MQTARTRPPGTRTSRLLNHAALNAFVSAALVPPGSYIAQQTGSGLDYCVFCPWKQFSRPDPVFLPFLAAASLSSSNTVRGNIRDDHQVPSKTAKKRTFEVLVVGSDYC